VSVILDQAADAKKEFLSHSQFIIDIAAILLTQTEQYISFVEEGSGLHGLSDWIEQLIAESTGKSGVGRLPVAMEDLESGAVGGALTVSFFDSEADLVVTGELGEHFIFWEWVTALVGAGLEIDPFNQPNVAEAKSATAELLSQWKGVLPQFIAPHFDKEIAIFGGENSLAQSLRALIHSVPAGGYISIQAYLDRKDDTRIYELRKILSEKSGVPVTFGWGPRFLHSTGQFHKGGQPNGAFLQITGACQTNFEIPGSGFSFETLLMAQALGDFQALQKRKFPLLRLHLKDRPAGITQLLEAARLL
jgi:glucose-6-phosphate isomerase